MNTNTTPAAVGSSAELGVTVNRALFVPECQRLNEWALIGPVQRAALESFAERLLAAERDRWKKALTERHDYLGGCPDDLDDTARDPNCPACRALLDLGA